ncbi:MAG: DNA methylase, partial [Treponema sp.]|nr:DNA methylase [Treponema sp.]
HVYSIDEVFIDATSYLKFYKTDAESLVRRVIKDILSQTGITATAGIAPNLFLCKIAMDIVAKHAPADENGVRLASLTVKEYREKLWDHKPITDFWRIGRGIAARLARLGLYTMGDIARFSIKSEDFLYKIFGIDAEILIDHAWGIEPCTIANIKNYKTYAKSVSEGQVLLEPYTFEKGRTVVREMAEVLSQNLKSKELAADLFTLYISYDRSSLTPDYQGPLEADPYGRPVPKSSHGLARSILPTASMEKISQAILSIYDRVADPELYIRRFNISAENVIHQKEEQPDLFTDLTAQKKEVSLQSTMLEIQKRFGKNAILKASDYTEGATLRERNQQIGGHRA